LVFVAQSCAEANAVNMDATARIVNGTFICVY
jgi:hypothetical protein